jgi:hypothetical protein
MKKTFSTVFTKLNRKALFAISVVSFFIVLACADGLDWSDVSHVSNKAFIPSYYSPLGYNPHITYDDYKEYDYKSANLEDWSAYLGEKITKEKLDELLYTFTQEQIDSLREAREKPETKGPFCKFIDYLSLAKRSEKFAYDDWYSWYYSDQTFNKDSAALAMKDVWINEFNKATEDFLKQRILFQLVRTHYFSNHPAAGIVFAKEHNDRLRKVNELMYWRIRGYEAACHHKLKNYPQSNAIYAEMMAQNENYVQSSDYSFHFMDDSDILKCLDLCSTNEARIQVWMMIGKKYDPHRAIEEILQIDPKHATIEVLIGRMISSKELEIRGLYEENNPQADIDKDIRVYKKIIDHPNAAARSQAYAAISYMLYLKGSYNTSWEFLKNAKATNTDQNNLYTTNLRIFEVLLELEDLDHFSDENRKEMMWAMQLQSDWQNGVSYYGIQETLISKLNMYFRSSKDVRRLAIRPTTHEMQKLEDLHALRLFLENTQTEPLSVLVKDLSSYSLSDVYHILSVRYTFDNDIENAISFLKKSGADTLTISGNPFSSRIRDCHECDHAEFKGPYYSKLAFLDGIKVRKNELLKAPTYTSAIELGNAFYNLSYHGNARLYSELDSPKYYFYWPREEDEWYYDSYYMNFNEARNNVEKARAYYEKALIYAQTDEQKAEAHYLLSKCEYVDFISKENKPDNTDFIAGKHFQSLANYSQTKYYQKVLNECGYFRTYINKK